MQCFSPHFKYIVPSLYRAALFNLQQFYTWLIHPFQLIYTCFLLTKINFSLMMLPTAASTHWKKKKKVIRSNCSYFQLSKMCLIPNLNIFNLIYEHIGLLCFGEWWDPIEKWSSNCVSCLILRHDYSSLGALNIFKNCLYSQFALSLSTPL